MFNFKRVDFYDIVLASLVRNLEWWIRVAVYVPSTCGVYNDVYRGMTIIFKGMNWPNFYNKYLLEMTRLYLSKK